MSIMVSVYVNDGIVMASDSKATGGNGKTIAPENGLPYGDVKKLFPVNNANIGVSCCGSLNIVTKTPSEIIPSLGSSIDVSNQGNMVTNIANYLSGIYNITNGSQYFHVCGYHNSDQFIYLVSNGTVSQKNTTIGNNIILNGETQEIQELLDIYKVIDFINRIHNTAIITEDALVANSISKTLLYWARQTTNPFDSMSVDEAKEFAYFLINFTIEYKKYMKRSEVCGGKIDIITLTANTPPSCL